MTHCERSASAAGPTTAERATAGWIQGLINEAIKSGATSVKIPAGNYRVAAPVAGHEVLNVLGAHDLTIDATGVRLMVTEPIWGLYVRWSNDVTVKGLSVDYDPLPFTQGTIIAKAADNSWYNVQIHDGYDMMAGDTRAIFYDHGTGNIKPNTVSEFGSVMPAGNRVVRVSGSPFQGDVQVNDFVSFTRTSSPLHAVEVQDTTGSTFQDITVQSSPNYGIFETSGGGNTYRDVQVVPGPKPAGATQARLLSSTADGFHSFNTSVGPKIIDSHFANEGDDAIAIHGMYALVGKASGSKVIVSSPNNLGLSFQVGDNVRGYNRTTGAVTEATVTAIEPDSSLDFSSIRNAFLPQHLSGPFTLGFQLTLDKPLTIGTGDLLTSPDRTGSGYEVLNTTIENNRARGIIAKGSNGLIEGNTIDGSTIAGIVVAGEPWPWQEGDFSHDVTIRNNLIKNTGHVRSNSWETESGAISITGSYGWTSAGHSNINVTGNVVQDAWGANLVVNLAQGVTVSSNQFINPLSRPTTSGSQVNVDPTSVISIDRVSNVAFVGNTVLDQGPYGENLLRSTTNSSGLSAADTGIRVIHNESYTVVADYRDNFRPGMPQSGWKYLWNRVGEIGDPGNYVPLVAISSVYAADFTTFPAHNSGQYIHLGADGGHPGMGALDGVGSDKYAIAAYSVAADGLYAIRDSFIRALDLKTNGVRVFVNVNDDSPVLNQDISSGATASFDVLLGQLKRGDTIYVGVGPNGSHVFDTFHFDFSIAKYLTGDYNGDGVVDAADYTVWRDKLGSTTSPAADGNANRVVDLGDYQLWKSSFTSNDGMANALARLAGEVPEPSSGCLTLLLVLTLALSGAARGLSGRKLAGRCLLVCREKTAVNFVVADFDTKMAEFANTGPSQDMRPVTDIRGTYRVAVRLIEVKVFFLLAWTKNLLCWGGFIFAKINGHSPRQD